MNSKIVALAFFALIVGCAICSEMEAQSHGHTQAPTPVPTSHARNTAAPTQHATAAPTKKPTAAPTQHATAAPTQHATAAPTKKPTAAPTQASTSSSSTSGSGSLCGVTSTSSEPLKLLVPLYVYPGSAWDAVVTAASTGVKIIAIINPNSGPDPAGPDSSYNTYMTKLTNAGVDMVGYVHTTYGERSSADVYADIDTYASKYPGLKGIFIDEAAATASEISYYSGVYSHIIAKSGYSNVILNPGTQPDQGYLAVSTNIVIFEDVYTNLKNNFASWVTCAPTSSQKAGYKYKFSGIAYGASSGSMSSILSTMMNSGMGLVYVTDVAGGCCTYNTLSTYFASEATTVKAMN